MAPMARPTSASVEEPPPKQSMKKFKRRPRSAPTRFEAVESEYEYDSMPSIARRSSPESAMALPTACCANWRVVLPAPRT